MRTLKMVVAYNGSAYAGWQWQPNILSVDKVLRNTFKHVFKQDSFYLVAASRTDAGVHAQGQVVRIKTSLKTISLEKILYAYNKSLPQDILILSIEEVNSCFHPQHNIAYKIYEYTIFTERPNPQYAHIGWYVSESFNKERLQAACKLFIGTHDFRHFSKEDSSKNTTRTIISIDIEYDALYKKYLIRIKGTSFLRYMVRRIVGAALTVALDKNQLLPITYDSIFKPKHSKLLLTAPAQGLCLVHIEYISMEIQQ